MTKFLDYNGLSYFWTKIKSFFVSKTDFEQTTQNLESEILLPNFDEMTPIKTIELDVASTSYYQLFSRTNTDISTLMTEVDDTVMFRITTTGTNIYAVTDFFVKYRSGLIYPFVAGYNDTYGVSAATTGLYYVRFQYPKTLNSGYAWLCDFRTYNATARHIKVEVFATTENITWADSLTATTYNSTYQTDSGGVSPYDKRGCFYNGTLYAAATSAGTASYTTSMHNKHMFSHIVKAGEALVANYLLYVNNGYAYRISNKKNAIDVDFGINGTGTSYSANTNIAYTQFRVQGGFTFTTDTNLTYDPIELGDKVYLRCRLVGDNIYSDGHLSTKMTAGYTWYLLGAASSATQVSLSAFGSMFITLDENGMISHINGKPTQFALATGNYERLFCGKIESDVSADSTLKIINGRSIVFNQLVENGDFGNDTTGWAATSSATLSVSGNVLSAYRSNGQANFGAVTKGNNGKVYKDHKYFYSIYAKASKTMNAYTPYLDTTYVTRMQSAAPPFQLTTDWQRFAGLFVCIKEGQPLFGIRNYTSAVGEATIYMKNAMVIDLTKMFGTGNEPTDVELLKKMFPLDYYDYNLGGTLLGGTQTGFKSEDSSNNTLTNLSIPITTLTGKPSGSSTSEVMFPNGLLGIGDVRDEIDFAIGKAYKRVGWRAYASGDAIGTTMLTDGTYTSYVLQDAVEYTIDTVPTVGYDTEQGGYEQWLPVNTSTPTVAPICCISAYQSGSIGGTYTAGNGIAISNSNEISVVIDSSNANGLSVGSSGMSFNDSNLVHKTNSETIAGRKTFVDGIVSGDVVIGTGSISHLQSYLEAGAYINDGNRDVAVVELKDYDNDYSTILSGLHSPISANDAANKEYVDGHISDVKYDKVKLNMKVGTYGVFQQSLCAFYCPTQLTSMAMTSFTTSGGNGAKSVINGLRFPIGCKIYYYGGSSALTANQSYDNVELYTSFYGVDGRYSAISGTSLSLGDTPTNSNSSVYLHVNVTDSAFWYPYYKSGETNEVIVSSDQLVEGHFYIYLGKTVGTNEHDFQLEDNNPLYYYDGDVLLSWAVYYSRATLLTKADKVSNAMNGNFAGLDSNGNLTDSGYKPSDFVPNRVLLYFNDTRQIGQNESYYYSLAVGSQLPAGTYKVTVMRHIWSDGSSLGSDNVVNATVYFQKYNSNTKTYIVGGTYVLRVVTSPNNSQDRMCSAVVYLTGFLSLNAATAVNDNVCAVFEGSQYLTMGGEQPLSGSNMEAAPDVDFILFEKII